MKLGIGTYTFMWSIGFAAAEPKRPLTAMDLLAKAKSLGVNVVQFGPNLSLADLDADELTDLVHQAETWGIDLEVGTTGCNVANLRRQLALANHVGSKLIRTTTESSDGSTSTISEIRLALDTILPELAENHVTLAIENGKVPACNLANLIASAASPWIGVTLDTVNSLAIPEGPAHIVETLLPHVKSAHVKDFQVERIWHRMGFSIEGRPAGHGQLNVPNLLSELKETNPAANVILELWPPQQATLEETIQLEDAWAVDSIHYLRRYITD